MTDMLNTVWQNVSCPALLAFLIWTIGKKLETLSDAIVQHGRIIAATDNPKNDTLGPPPKVL